MCQETIENAETRISPETTWTWRLIYTCPETQTDLRISLRRMCRLVQNMSVYTDDFECMYRRSLHTEIPSPFPHAGSPTQPLHLLVVLITKPHRRARP